MVDRPKKFLTRGRVDKDRLSLLCMFQLTLIWSENQGEFSAKPDHVPNYKSNDLKAYGRNEAETIF